MVPDGPPNDPAPPNAPLVVTSTNQEFPPKEEAPLNPKPTEPDPGKCGDWKKGSTAVATTKVTLAY